MSTAPQDSARPTGQGDGCNNVPSPAGPQNQCPSVETVTAEPDLEPQGQATAEPGPGPVEQGEPPAEEGANDEAGPAYVDENTEDRRVTTRDVNIVQSLIERCLQMYLSKNEVLHELSQQANVETAFTGLVWQKLEEQNKEFFKAYYTRLKFKDQIVLFNHLLQQQHKMLHHYGPGMVLTSPRQSTAPFYPPAAQHSTTFPPEGAAAAAPANSTGLGQLGPLGDFPLPVDPDAGGIHRTHSDFSFGAGFNSPLHNPLYPGDTDAVEGLPRKFSMSDLNMAEGGGLADLPCSFTFGDLAPFDMGSNGGGDPSPASGSGEKGGRPGTPTSPASLYLNRSQENHEMGEGHMMMDHIQPGAGESPP
eukprot:jgi/Botrbrau1/12120/Bobra.0186s0038.1